MNRAIRRVGIACTLLVLALAGQLSYLQIYDAEDLENDPRNVRAAIRDFSRPRGDILTADGEVIATSVPDEDGDDFDFQRQYPLGDLFGHISGYQSFVFGNSGVEKSYNDELVGRDIDLDVANIGDVLTGKENTGNVVLSVRADAQRAARDGLGGQRGSVVAIDPRRGAILAMYSNPTYDPSPLAGHDIDDVQDFGTFLQANAAKPDLARAFRERFPPGSTFKVVTAGVALETGAATPESQFPSVTSIPLPQTDGQQLRNFGGNTCGGSLADSFRRSCNTTFAALGLQLADGFVPGMESWGIGSAPPLDVSPGSVESVGPEAGSFQQNQPRFALAGIGQGDVATTPLQMALIACGVANGGVIMVPHAMAEITDAEGDTVSTYDEQSWTTAVNPQTASTLNGFMRSVVEDGTGTAGQIEGVPVAGKTGTAENLEGGPPHAWFIAFAPADDPQVAVAVFVEGGGSFGNEATGGRVAAPIAAGVMRVILGV